MYVYIYKYIEYLWNNYTSVLHLYYFFILPKWNMNDITGSTAATFHP